MKGRKEMRLWFEGIIKRREAFGGVNWNLSVFEHQEEELAKRGKSMMPEITTWNKTAAHGFCVSGGASHRQEAGLHFL